jgi:hypothetical protein
MPTTTNNGWPTPADTDLVKNGADAIRDLGQAIDTTLGVYSPVTPGLVKISTTSFSAVASQSFNDVFSATYENYRIVGTLAGSGTFNLLYRFRVGGSDNSTSNYTYSFGRARSTDFQTTFSGASQTSAQIGVVAQTTNAKMPFSFDIYQPFASFYSCGLGFQQDNSNAAQNMGGWYFTGNTSFTGFSFITSTGTMSGEVSIYGYNK